VDIVRSPDTINATAVWLMDCVWLADIATIQWVIVHSRRHEMQLQHHQHFQHEWHPSTFGTTDEEEPRAYRQRSSTSSPSSDSRSGSEETQYWSGPRERPGPQLDHRGI